MLVSAGHRDSSLAQTALREGRTLVVLEPEVARIKTTSESLDALTASAAKDGMWARMLSGPVVTVGPNKLPIQVPVSNIPNATASAVADAQGDGTAEPERIVANNDATVHGLEIRVRLLDGIHTSLYLNFLGIRKRLCVCQPATRCPAICSSFLGWQMKVERLCSQF